MEQIIRILLTAFGAVFIFLSGMICKERNQAYILGLNIFTVGYVMIVVARDAS